jgi:hypothetical protein
MLLSGTGDGARTPSNDTYTRVRGKNFQRKEIQVHHVKLGCVSPRDFLERKAGRQY